MSLESVHPLSVLERGVLISDALVLARFARTKREFREFVREKILFVNEKLVRDFEGFIDLDDLTPGGTITLRRGNSWHTLRWV